MIMNNRMYYSQEAAVEAQRQRAVLVVVMLGLGVAVGAASALLFAPEAGEKVRKALEEAIEQAAESGREQAAKAVENLQDEVDRLRSDVENRINNA
jgi:gas vesicle protein